jgi:antitoxin component YwqK of YwqJK toxin-antitoxin module
MRVFAFTGLLLWAVTATAQTDTVFNQTDKQGRKQGFWKVKYQQGELKYTAFFKDDKPAGLMKRYYESGRLKAEMKFDTRGEKAFSKIYYEQGPLQADGNFIGTRKDSVWTYYSFYSKNITKRETYKNGVLNGFSWVYYPDGKISEQREWKNGIPVNDWIRYYQNDSIFMKTSFTDGKRSGTFILNYQNGTPQWRGQYLNDLPEGKWVNYNQKGEVAKTIEYKNGEALNADQLLKEEKAYFDKMEKQKGSIAEPDEYNFWPKGQQPQ